MRICIYCEPLRTATSGTPMRAMIKELLRIRSNDHFLLVVRKNYERNKILASFFSSLKDFDNWELVVDHLPRKLSNLLGLLHYRDYCKVRVNADVYVNPDCNSLGRVHPLIITVHDLSSFRPLQYTSYKSYWQLWLRRFMIRNGISSAEKVVSISAFTRDEIIKEFKTNIEKVLVIYNGINQEWINQPAVTVPGTSSAYWIWWGMITHRKNLHNLVKAYGELHRKKDHGSLPLLKLVYSNHEFPESLQQLIFSEGIDDKVILEKSQPLEKLIDNVSGSIGLLFPSFIEGFGMPVVEAFARGIPVLTSNTTSLSEVAGGLAVMVNPSDIKTIVNGLEKILDPALNSIEKQEKRKQHAMQFTPAKTAEKYAQLIDQLYEQVYNKSVDV